MSYQRYGSGFVSAPFIKLRTEYSIEPPRTSTTNKIIEKRKYNIVLNGMDKISVMDNNSDDMDNNSDNNINNNNINNNNDNGTDNNHRLLKK